MIKMTKLMNSALMGMSFKSSLDSCGKKIKYNGLDTIEERQI